MAQLAKSFSGEAVLPVKLKYWLHLPKGYKANGKAWPVILFLHGAGERGSNPALVKKHGIPKIAAAGGDMPFIAISPQCPAHSWWFLQVPAVLALLDEVLATHNADPERVYLTGMSMGGNGVWATAMHAPKRFAAIAPVCPHHPFFVGLPEDAKRIKHLPVWVFHGAADTIVPIDHAAVVVKALQDVGADVQFTVYPTTNHDSWSETYANPALYRWFLKHKRRT
jgi:predicted peptidase